MNDGSAGLTLMLDGEIEFIPHKGGIYIIKEGGKEKWDYFASIPHEFYHSHSYVPGRTSETPSIVRLLSSASLDPRGLESIELYLYFKIIDPKEKDYETFTRVPRAMVRSVTSLDGKEIWHKGDASKEKEERGVTCSGADV